jgi:hypothetical protein
MRAECCILYGRSELGDFISLRLSPVREEMSKNSKSKDLNFISQQAQQEWLAHLASLLNQAKQRFADVSWVNENDQIWAHKGTSNTISSHFLNKISVLPN